MLVWLLSAGNFVIGMGAFVVLGILNPMAEGLGMSSSAAGWVLTTYALAYGVASPLAVAATGRLSRRTVLAAGLALFGLAALGSALAPTPAALYATRAFAALGAGIFTPVAAVVAAAASPPAERGRALARVFFGLTLAQVLGVPVGSFVAYTLGWQTSFLLVAILAVPCLIGILARVPRDLPFQPTRLASLGEVLADWRTLLAILFTASLMIAVYVVYTYLAPLLAETMGFGRNGISAAFLVFGFGAVAGQPARRAARGPDRAGPHLVGLAVGEALLMPVFSTLPMPVLSLFALVFVWSLCGWSFMAPQQSRLIAIAPDRAAVVLALNAAAIYLGAAGGSAVGAAVIGRSGVGALGIAGGLMALVALADILLARAVRPRHLPSTI